MDHILNRIGNIGIVPVVKINHEEETLPVAQALLDGGIDTMEITFRSEHTIYAIKEISKKFPEMLIGAGTVGSVQQAIDAVEAGATFIVTPGFNHDVAKWCVDNKVVIIPGIGTPTEIETALSYGITNMKLFPAVIMGGDKFIKDISGPYPHVRIMPTGGINMNNMHDYLKLKNVIAIGGSFMLPNDLIANKEWDRLKDLSQASVQAMLQLKVEALHSSHINTQALELVDAITFADNREQIELSTPYLERTHYHLSKSNKNIRLNDKTLIIEQDDKTTIHIKERNI